MEFGKNRIQFSTHFWTHYKYEKFNVYFREKGKNIADYAARSIHLQIQELENQFEYRLSEKIQFIIYNTQGQSRESNIGNYPDELLKSGEFARVIGNKVFLFFNGDHEKFDFQIRTGVSRMLVDEILFGYDFSDEIKNEALINFPDLYYEGLISYLSGHWSVNIESKVKASFNSGLFDKFNWLKGDNALLAGHSIWYFIADKYGEEVIANIFYMSKIHRSFSDGILFVLGISPEELISDWKMFFKTRFLRDNKSKLPTDSNNIGIKKLKKDRSYQRLMVNKSGDFIAYTTNKLSQQKVFVFNRVEKQNRCILRLGHKIDILPDYSSPVLAWHSAGEVLSVFYEFKGEVNWLTYNVKTKEKINSKLFQIEKILEANYSLSGRKIVLSAVKDGKTDIFVLDVAARAKEQITNDFFDNRSPVFLNNDQIIIFSSNRENDSMSVHGNKNLVYKHSFDLFAYNYSNKSNFKYSPQVLFRLTHTPNFNEKNPISVGWNRIQYLSDENGIQNEWEAQIDSTVAFVDTSIHYRFFTKTNPVTNYTSSVLFHSSNGKHITRVFKSSSKNSMSVSDLKHKSTNLTSTNFMKAKSEKISSDLNDFEEQKTKVLTIDSIKLKMKLNEDFLFPDYYIFTDEMDDKKNDSVVKVIRSISNTALITSGVDRFPTSDSLATKVKQRNYELAFRTADISLDLDNRFLNPQYQRYSGGNSYPMPGLNGFLKYTVIDLFEDHILTGGFRVASFFSNEFFISYTNRKKRLDKQYLLYRGTHTDVDKTTSYLKNITYEGIYRVNYPFSMIDRLSTTASVRYDQSIPLSKDILLLKSPIYHQFWPNIRMDYTFDNTRLLGINLYSGLRFKIFTEYYQELPEINNRMFTFGSDIRHYLKIYKSLIWANRIAGGSSLGPNRLMFFMGGVDSWTAPTFNEGLKPSKLSNGNRYSFQTLATNMRGFIQNGRNGSSFVVFNSEIRFPIIQFLFLQPFSSDFINNFQIIGFGDFGTAWSGKSPFLESNSLNYQNILIGEEARTGEIVLKTNREPIIGGFGFGLRTTIIGYFIRADWAWGVEDGVLQKRTFYLSLTTDF